jgi:glucosamine--fructose-6-phosphate aminotransferase (isomerizing)
MCGIVGYIGRREAMPIIVDGLTKLEYRGYDSFGIATISGGIELDKHQGRISDSLQSSAHLKGKIGIGHTRWATHGVPNDINAHPHMDCSNCIAVVHNGIIENYSELKRQLISRGHVFRSETDTEVVAHLVEEAYAVEKDLLSAMQKVVPMLTGSYALLVMTASEDRIIAARYASPLVLGIGDGEFLAASDMTPIIEYTERAIFLEDGDIASISHEKIEIFHEGKQVQRPMELVDWSREDTKKGGFAHYMLKEIYEQPQAFYNSVRSVTDETLPIPVKTAESVTVIACGSSYNAGLIFKYLLEDSCAIPVRLDFSSEFKYFPPPIEGLVIGISQSGETADSITAIKRAKVHNCTTLAITNVLGSSISRIADFTLFMRAGPEISVAATKSFVAQLAILMQIVNFLRDNEFGSTLLNGHRAIEEILLMDLSDAVALVKDAQDIFYVGRGPFYPVSLEGALKMKEISYIHAEGYAAGELKHGPFALLSKETPVVAICMPGETYGVMSSNIKEMKARGAPIIALGEAGDLELSEVADVFIPLPKTHPFLQVVTTLVVLQLLAYHTAVTLDRDVDKPRNLAKSVTVE